MTGWQPIETAPKDGRYILLFDPSASPDHRVVRAHFNDYWETADGTTWLDNVTHWMPLPDPPEASS